MADHREPRGEQTEEALARMLADVILRCSYCIRFGSGHACEDHVKSTSDAIREHTRAAVAEAVEKTSNYFTGTEDEIVRRAVRAAVERELIEAEKLACAHCADGVGFPTGVTRWHLPNPRRGGLRHRCRAWRIRARRVSLSARPEVWDRVTALREGFGS